MTTIHGFQLVSDQQIRELRTQVRIFRHEKTRARLLSLSNGDENKVFGITFRTPPSDSTGVAHILEHSVLCGSRKYPVREPFVELLKGSLHTFLNAMTYPDKTTYPVASQNTKDFYNLIDVYLDAVFYPRLTPFVFQQEGWHFELEGPDLPMTYKGVVFNEMKGAYSSPDNLLAEYSVQSLFPDNAYGFDSGGNPKEIPSLSFEKFVSFHKRFYHPSNAYIYFYGDDDPDERLRFLNGYLKEFEPIEVDSRVQLQPLFKGPKRIVRPYMVGDDDRETAKGMITVNWLLKETSEVETNFALRILDHILLGMPASPLRKALIDSGLGEDIAGEGLGTELRQTYFSTGLRGIQLNTADRVEDLILSTLKTLSKIGLDFHTVEAALNTIEFRLRENNTGNFPRGLALMLRSLGTWLYEGDPISLVAFEAPLESIKAKARHKGSYFAEMIYRYLVDNHHRATLILEPDPQLRAKEEADERERLSKVRSSLKPSQLDRMIDNTLELRRIQQVPDPPEALAAIPVLKLTDLDRNNKTLPLSQLDLLGTKILFHDLFTNGIAYLDVGFDIHALPDHYLPYVPLFGRALVEMGTETEDFVTLTQRIGRNTGGIRPQTFLGTMKDPKRSTARLFLRGKATIQQGEDLIQILKDVLLGVRLDDQRRFQQMLLEEKARWEQQVIPGGHRVVNLRLRSHFDEAHWAMEKMEGLSYLFFLKKLSHAVEQDWPGVLSILLDIHRILVNRNTMVLNLTLDQDNWIRFEPRVKEFLDALPQGHAAQTEWSPESPPTNEGLTIASQVNYVGKAVDLYKAGYGFHGSALVITRYIRTTWLWDRVRVQGGAYGAFSLFDRFSGVLTFVSYRDPNLHRTLEIFEQTGQALRNMDLGKEELTKSIIGAIGDLDAHMLPDAKGYASMVRHLTGDSDEDRQRMREEVLGTKESHFRAFGQVVQGVMENGVVKVLGSPSAIREDLTDRIEGLQLLKVL